MTHRVENISYDVLALVSVRSLRPIVQPLVLSMLHTRCHLLDEPFHNFSDCPSPIHEEQILVLLASVGRIA